MTLARHVPGEPPRDESPRRRRLAAWLQEQLFARRIVLVAGRLDDDTASEAAAALMALDTNGDTPIALHIDSADGTIEAAFVLIDTLDLLRAAVRALCRGQVGGPVIGVLAAADHRAAAPHTRFRLFQPTARFTGTPRSLIGRGLGRWGEEGIVGGQRMRRYAQVAHARIGGQDDGEGGRLAAGAGALVE
jgi:Clp protease